MCTTLFFFWRREGSVHCNFGDFFVWGSGSLSVSSSCSAALAESRLSWVWALEHAVYLLCNHRCGSSKTSSQHCSSSVATTSHWDSLLSLFIISSGISFGFSRQAVTLIGSEVCPFCRAVQSVCTKNVELPLCLLLLPCPQKLHTYLRCEIWCVCKLTEGAVLLECKQHQTKMFPLEFITSVYMCVTLCAVVKRQKCTGSLCMPAYTGKDKGMGFPVLQFVCSRLWMLVLLPVHLAFTYMNVGLLKVNLYRFCI